MPTVTSKPRTQPAGEALIGSVRRFGPQKVLQMARPPMDLKLDPAPWDTVIWNVGGCGWSVFPGYRCRRSGWAS